ncbi:bZIP transcription factor 1 [Phytophthora citrophthora]|uniref:BZIP transcription factor 1 n=1 Tax=Phytophthora citrophthora TaxID=4793 RepID=A0AAD9G1Y7_9STRA|nr:bZIP transcription factor 1 [Phytophthora citrophthora]
MMASRRTFDRSPAPFSDAVIGNVLTRASAPGYQAASPQQPIQYTPPSTVTLPPLRNLSPLATSNAQTFQSRPMTIRLQRDAVPVPPVRSFPLTHSLRPSSSFRPVDSPARAVSATVATLSINHVGNATPKQKRKRGVSVKSEACREQCRTNQARYRQKQREYVSKLESTVSGLRDEIPMLEVQRRRLRYDSQQRVWDVVVEYFQLFRHGVVDAGDQGSAGSSDVLRASEAQQQLMFLRSTMAPDVEFGDVSGVELLMDHWRRLSEYHENLQFQLTHMDKVSESIVTATATLSVTITKTTLESVFPRLMRSENVEDLSLAVKLLGHTLEYPCSVLFVWDEETSLVVRMETEIDMATPLLGLLGNLKDVSRVLTGAVMTPNGLMDEFMA